MTEFQPSWLLSKSLDVPDLVAAASDQGGSQQSETDETRAVPELYKRETSRVNARVRMRHTRRRL